MGTLNTGILWRGLAILALGWLAIVFGCTLRAGRMPLIERVARVSNPSLTPELCRYTRRLTAIWCAYFIIAALLCIMVPQSLFVINALVWSGTIALFAGEHWVRPRIFPGVSFPGLVQQLRDTCRAWGRGS